MTSDERGKEYSRTSCCPHIILGDSDLRLGFNRNYSRTYEKRWFYCPECGGLVENDSEYCTHCKADLTADF
jgi:hypothetical protein